MGRKLVYVEDKMGNDPWLWSDLCEKLQEELESYSFKNYVNTCPTDYGADLEVGILGSRVLGWSCNTEFLNKLYNNKKFRKSFIVNHIIPGIKSATAKVRLENMETDFKAKP